MREMWEDLRYGGRLLARSPGFTAVALTIIALGIGANATLYSLADAIYLRPLPVPDPARVVHAVQTRAESPDFFPFSLPDYLHYREHARTFEELAGHYPTSPMHLVIEGEAASVTGSVVTASYFHVLRIAPHLGRFFGPDEDSVRDRDAVAVIGYGFWQSRFAGDPQIVGRTLQVNGRAFTILGVAPRGFQGVLRGGGVSQIWIPSAMFGVGYRYCDAFDRGCAIVELLGRLKPQATIEAAQAEMSVLARQLEVSYPSTNAGHGVLVHAARGAFPTVQGNQASIVALLLGGVSLLLLIACANVAGLLLARGMARRREIAIRLALGSGRWRLVRQLAAEGALLALAGSALGLLVSAWAKDLVTSFYATDYAGRPVHFDLAISGPVLAATTLLCGLTAVLCGLAPALQAARADVLPALKASAISGGNQRSRLRDGLVVAQFALSTMLLVGAGLLVRSVLGIERGPGVDPSRIVVLRLRPSLVDYDAARARSFQREVIRRLERMPAVEAASPSENMAVFGGGRRATLATLGGRPVLKRRVAVNPVGDRYFDVLGLPILAGRDFDSGDRTDTPPVAIADELLAAELGGAERAVGQMIEVDGTAHRIVGVARAAQYHAALEPQAPFLYLDYWQQDGRGFAADSRTHLRVRGYRDTMMSDIRREIAAIDPSVPLSEDYSLRERVRFNFRPVRMIATLLGSFGVLALVLSSVGLYGVVTLATAMRTREIAIRVAIGAGRGQVRSLVLRHGARLGAIGAVLGLAAAFATAHLLASLLYGVDRYDPRTFIGAPALLFAVALLASWMPARRAMRVEPALTLRQE